MHIMSDSFKKETVELESLLRRLSMVLRSRHKKILNDFHITFPQFMVLLALGHSEEVIMTDLVENIHMAPPTATGVVDRLVSQELVERFRSDDDRRVVKVRLTEKGKTVLKEVKEKKLQLLEDDLKAFTSEECNILISLLEKLYNSVQSSFENM